MAINLKKFKALKQRADDARRETDRAQGTLEELEERLKEEFGCSSIKEAKAKLSELKDKQKEDVALFNQRLASFEEEFGEVLQ